MSPSVKLGHVPGVYMTFRPNHKEGHCRFSVHCHQDDVLMQVSWALHGEDLSEPSPGRCTGSKHGRGWIEGWGRDFETEAVQAISHADTVTVMLKLNYHCTSVESS